MATLHALFDLATSTLNHDEVHTLSLLLDGDITINQLGLQLLAGFFFGVQSACFFVLQKPQFHPQGNWQPCCPR